MSIKEDLTAYKAFRSSPLLYRTFLAARGDTFAFKMTIAVTQTGA
jgi:hypothetical protein